MAVTHPESMDTTHLSNTLIEKLTSQGYRVLYAETLKSLDNWAAQALDAVLITESPLYDDAFAQQQAQPIRPLVVLLTSNADRLITPSTTADFTLSIAHPHLVVLLAQLLSKHQSYLRVAEKAHLYDTLKKEQTRLNDEIELLKNAIVRNVSHELKTPLLQLKAAISLINDTVSSLNESDKKLVTYAENATARLELIIQNITLLGNSLDVNPSPIILRDIIEHVKRTMRRIWERKNDIDRIELQTQPALPPIYADKQGLSTVLQLLIDNALKFSTGKVTVNAYREGDKIHIEVADTGIGISPEKIANIFDMFYQIDSSSTRRYGGMGIGLSIVKLIIDRHQSEISVISEEGKGSTFRFIMPVFDLT